MARFAADPTVAAMAQRAAHVMQKGRLAQLPSGQLTAQPQMPSVQAPPSSFLQNRVSQLDVRANPNVLAALRQTPYGAESRSAIYQRAADAHAPYARAQASGLENAGQFGSIYGLSDEDLQARAAAYASGRSYGGSAYQPGQVMQEGHVEIRDGVPGVYIKYRTEAGDSTEWTPIG